MRQRYVRVAASFLALCLVAPLVHSQDKPTGDKPAGDANKQPSMEEMMKAWEKYGSPGKEHEIFKAMEGKFQADVTVTMPGAPKPEKSTGTADNELLFGGRYLMNDFSGTMMGKSFQGGGLWAYDKLKEKYVNIWIDDMSTMIMVSEGKADPSGKVITVTTTCPDPLGGKEKTLKGVLTVVDNDNHTYEMFERASEGAGEEIKTLSIKYARVKQ